MTIRSGYGLQPLHLRQPAAELRKHFGAPMRRRTSDALREYWIYSDLGFECIVSRKSHRILSLFLHAETVGPGSILPDEVSSPFGLTPDQIRAAFGRPNLEGGGFAMGDGTWVGLWFSYDTGIGFHFNEEQRVTTLSIFARKRRLRTKPSVAVAAPASSHVAALRRG